MSEFFRPEDRPVPQGAEFPEDVLSADREEALRKRGFAGEQNQLAHAIGRGTEVNFSNGQNAPVHPADEGGRPAKDVANMSLGGVQVTVRPTDRRTIEGSTPGDHRQKASPAVLPPNPAPRQPVGQALQK